MKIVCAPVFDKMITFLNLLNEYEKEFVLSTNVNSELNSDDGCEGGTIK